MAHFCLVTAALQCAADPLQAAGGVGGGGLKFSWIAAIPQMKSMKPTTVSTSIDPAESLPPVTYMTCPQSGQMCWVARSLWLEC